MDPKPVNKETYSPEGYNKVDNDVIEGIFELLGLDTDGEVFVSNKEPVWVTDPDWKGHEVDADYRAEKQHERYHGRKAKGLCPACGKPQDTEKVHCDPCLCKNRVFKPIQGEENNEH